MRKHYLDNIRWATVLLVVLYHAIFMYNHVVTAGVVGPVTDCRWQDALQYLLYPWFMVVLFLVSGASARYALDSRSGKAFFAERTRKLLVPSTLGLLVLGVAAWVSAQVLNPPIIQVYRFGIYIFSYLAGYYVFSQPQVMDALARRAPILCAAAAALGPVYLWHSWGKNYAVAPNVNSPLAIAYGWAACLAVFGGMKRWGDRTGPVAAFLARHSFGLYVCHYLALSAAAYGLVCCLHWRGAVVYLLSAVAAYGGGLALYAVLRHVPVVRYCVFGIKKEKPHVL